MYQTWGNSNSNRRLKIRGNSNSRAQSNSFKIMIMSKLAERYLSVPASLGQVERLFSIAGKIFVPRDVV